MKKLSYCMIILSLFVVGCTRNPSEQEIYDEADRMVRQTVTCEQFSKIMGLDTKRYVESDGRPGCIMYRPKGPGLFFSIEDVYNFIRIYEIKESL